MQQLHDKFGSAEEGVHCLNSESPTFSKDLKALAKQMNANLVLECVSGPLTGIISECLPPSSTIVMYGQLSEQKIEGISGMMVIGLKLKIEGFLLSNWLREKNIFGMLSATKKAKALIEEVVVNKPFGLH